jgi:hypothetical protein
MRYISIVLVAILSGFVGGALNGVVETQSPRFTPAAAKQSLGVIQAKELQIVDDLGRITALVGTANGVGAIFLKEGVKAIEEVPPVVLSVRDGHGLLLLHDFDGEQGVELGIGSALGGRLFLSDGEGDRTVTLGSDLIQRGILWLFDGKGEGNKYWDSRDVGATSSLPGDFDNDNDVDFTDFLTFASNFGRTI